MIGAITAGLFSTPTAPVTSSYESISTVTVGSGGNTFITFSSIPSTYKHLQVRWSAVNSAALTDLYMRVGNGSVDSGLNYSYHQIYGDGSAAAASAGATQTLIYCGLGGTTTQPSAGVLDIVDYQNSNKYKTVRALTGQDSNGSGYIQFKSGLWQSTSAISILQIYASSGTFNQYSSFALYGIKG